MTEVNNLGALVGNGRAVITFRYAERPLPREDPTVLACTLAELRRFVAHAQRHIDEADAWEAATGEPA